jgi:tRNA G18 (ribose-2'-O)-methylase SpoU
MPPPSLHASSFVVGVSFAFASIWVVNKFQKSEKKSGRGKKTIVAPPPSDGEVVDSPSLDQRLIRKAECVIRHRTSRLVVVIERCTNDHNYSAIHRTAEALGVQQIWVINPPSITSLRGEVDLEGEEYGSATEGHGNGTKAKLFTSTGKIVKSANKTELKERALHHLFAQRATEWLTVRDFDSTGECLKVLREEGYEVWATDLGQEAVCLETDKLAQARSGAAIPERLAIVMGTEAVGCTAEMLHGADMRVYLPLRGFADSLNLSVATALIVHHLFMLDPTLIGAMSEDERVELRRKWYAKLARQRLITKKKKKERGRLFAASCAIEEFEDKIAAGERLKPLQMKKLENCRAARAKLEIFDRELDKKAAMAVEDLVKNPPEPLTDMRRADDHRQTFVGKKTKEKNPEWKDMAATANAKTIQSDESASTAKFFREKLKQQQEQQQ